MWSEQPFEAMLKQRLAGLPSAGGDGLMADYIAARRYVVEEVAEHIGSAEPDLTDHGPRHLEDVMRRAHALLSSRPEYFSAYELYILAISILFHDVGNLHGRRNHQQKIGRIYAAARGDHARFRNERTAVLVIAGAHTGSASDGSKDTLSDVGWLNFEGETIRGRELAAVLRLADELAEGHHRTSAYLQNIKRYASTSLAYHAYANAVDYAVQNETPGRIAITLNINVYRKPEGLFAAEGVPLQDFLELAYHRIVKMDQERRYCKHFSPALQNLSETGAWFNFYHEDSPLNARLDPILLTDLIVPGDDSREIVQFNAAYAIPTLMGMLGSLCQTTEGSDV